MKDERRLIFLGSQKNPSFRVGFTKGDCLKSRALTVCRFKGGGGAWQERGVVFLRASCYPNAHYGQESLIE